MAAARIARYVKPCFVVWDMENAGVPTVLRGSLPRMVDRIKKNVITAGFGPQISIEAFGNHDHNVGEIIFESFKKQKLHIYDTPFKKADAYIAEMVGYWKLIHPLGGTVILFSGDLGLAKKCSDENPLFEFHVAAIPNSLSTRYFKKVQPHGGWVWPTPLEGKDKAIFYPTTAELKEVIDQMRK